MKTLARKLCDNQLKMYGCIPTFPQSKRGYLQTYLGYIKNREQYVDAVKQLNNPIITQIANEHLAIYDESPKDYEKYIHSIGVY